MISCTSQNNVTLISIHLLTKKDSLITQNLTHTEEKATWPLHMLQSIPHKGISLLLEI